MCCIGWKAFSFTTPGNWAFGETVQNDGPIQRSFSKIWMYFPIIP